MSDADIDSAAGVGQTPPSSSESSTDNATSGSVSTDNQTSDPSANGTSAAQGSALADNSAENGAQPSLTGGAETKAVAPTPIPYEKQYRDVQGWATKVHQTNLDLQRQLKELQTQFQSTQQKQADPQLRPWDESHPEHQQFLRLIDRAEYYEELIQGEENPEIVKSLQQKQLRLLGEQGVQQLRDWRDDVRRQERERRLNPKAFYAKLIRQEAQPVVSETLKNTSQQYQGMIKARDEAQSWVKSNPEVATPENIRAVIGMMEKGIKFDQASAMVERDHYRKQVSTAAKQAASAEEKERLLQGRAAGGINRNPNASPKIDVAKLRKDKGVQDGRAFTDMLFELDKEGLL